MPTTGAAAATLREQKAALRKRVLAARDALPAAERARHSTRITEQLLALGVYRAARSLLAYMTFGSEFDTGRLIAQALAQGKRLLLPRVNRETRRLDVHEVCDIAHDLAVGTWGIREPRPERCAFADLSTVDCVLLPGAAFTVDGTRLGYGGGFYDRLIPRFPARPPLIAAAFEMQLLSDIPTAAHDQRADLVVTERDAYFAC